MSNLLPVSLAALVQYYILLWRTPCPPISLLLLASGSRTLFACLRAWKWIRRVVLRQGSELDRIANLGPTVSDGGDSSETEDAHESEHTTEGSDEIRLLRAQDNKQRQHDLYAKWRLDYAISHSSSLKVQRAEVYSQEGDLSSIRLSDLSVALASAKCIAPSKVPRLKGMLVELHQLHTTLRDAILKEGKATYIKDDVQYQRQLKKLWKSLHYDQKKATLFDEDNVSPVATKEWQDLGFQGADPTTDWRSSGKLGLKCMTYFTQLYSQKGEAKDMVKQAVKGVDGTGQTLGWYPFALSFITVIDFLLRLIPQHSLSYIFLWSSLNVEQTFYRLSSLLVKHFHLHWIYLQTSEHAQEAQRARPVVMDYERISKRWKIEVRKWLERGKVGGWVDSRGVTFLPWDDGAEVTTSGTNEKVDADNIDQSAGPSGQETSRMRSATDL